MEVSGQLHAPAASPPEKETPVPIRYAVANKKKYLPLPRIESWSSNP